MEDKQKNSRTPKKAIVDYSYEVHDDLFDRVNIQGKIYVKVWLYLFGDKHPKTRSKQNVSLLDNNQDN